MERRRFLAASLAASAVALASDASAQPGVATAREFYLLRRYLVNRGPQVGLTERYIAEALIPALSRHSMGPVGAFLLDIGPETPAYYVLIPSLSVGELAFLDFTLAKDAEFMKAAEPFWSAPATGQAFLRVESSLLIAFEGWPRVTAPPAAASHGKRIFQLRTYESPSFSDHVRKVEMFHAGEFELFKAAGMHPVFFGDMLIGTRMPCLTYMLSFTDLAKLDAQWNAFRGDPKWTKLSTDPHYAYEQIVDNITNLVLSPLAASQI